MPCQRLLNRIERQAGRETKRQRRSYFKETRQKHGIGRQGGIL